MKFHYIREVNENRTGRAKRGTDTTAKKYHLTLCGREITPREYHTNIFSDECKNCARALDGFFGEG